jgi:hypothetical protein
VADGDYWGGSLASRFASWRLGGFALGLLKPSQTSREGLQQISLFANRNL